MSPGPAARLDLDKPPTRVSRLVDWRLFVVMAVIAMVAYLIYAGLTATQENARKGKRIDQLIVIVRQQEAEAQRARSAATDQREELLDNQHRLLTQLSKVQRELARARHEQPTSG